MEIIKAPRGTKDILMEASWKWAYVFDMCRSVADDFGYREVHLPIFEHTELFSRGIGDTTDVVEKEMYTFEDRGGRSVTLRPELTASMMRSYIENNLGRLTQPVKLWGTGSMFRYERPQKGRYREFWQLDVEAIGSQDCFADVEIIDFSLELYRRLGLSNLEVLVNSVGCPKCRPAYRKALQEYLQPHLDTLCDSCKGRFERNPLRILDCKSPICRAVTRLAPEITNSLCGECGEHFKGLLSGLAAIGASASVDKSLVRGLDYYTKTAYEILSGDLGAQNAICGGGRYDNLAEAIGGQHTPGVGFASGIERIVITMESQGCNFGAQPALLAFVVSQDCRNKAIEVLHNLRVNNIPCDTSYGAKNLKGQMKAAANSGARYAVIIGNDELINGEAQIKDLHTAQQTPVKFEDIPAYIKEGINK